MGDWNSPFAKEKSLAFGTGKKFALHQGEKTQKARENICSSDVGREKFTLPDFATARIFALVEKASLPFSTVSKVRL